MHWSLAVKAAFMGWWLLLSVLMLSDLMSQMASAVESLIVDVLFSEIFDPVTVLRLTPYINCWFHCSCIFCTLKGVFFAFSGGGGIYGDADPLQLWLCRGLWGPVGWLTPSPQYRETHQLYYSGLVVLPVESMSKVDVSRCQARRATPRRASLCDISQLWRVHSLVWTAALS